MEKRFSCFINRNSKIGKNIKYRHPNGIVIGKGVVIGNNCIIYQQVTIGGKNIGDMQKSKYPVIGNHVTLFAGAKIIGDITIGDYSIIGANSVVLKDVEPYSVYAGIPAKKVSDIKSGDE